MRAYTGPVSWELVSWELVSWELVSYDRCLSDPSIVQRLTQELASSTSMWCADSAKLLTHVIQVFNQAVDVARACRTASVHNQY